MRSSTTISPAIRKAMATGLTEDWATVAKNILASPWGKQIKSRATRLAYMFSRGHDPA